MRVEIVTEVFSPLKPGVMRIKGNGMNTDADPAKAAEYSAVRCNKRRLCNELFRPRDPRNIVVFQSPNGIVTSQPPEAPYGRLSEMVNACSSDTFRGDGNSDTPTEQLEELPQDIQVATNVLELAHTQALTQQFPGAVVLDTGNRIKQVKGERRTSDGEGKTIIQVPSRSLPNYHGIQTVVFQEDIEGSFEPVPLQMQERELLARVMPARVKALADTMPPNISEFAPRIFYSGQDTPHFVDFEFILDKDLPTNALNLSTLEAWFYNAYQEQIRLHGEAISEELKPYLFKQASFRSALFRNCNRNSTRLRYGQELFCSAGPLEGLVNVKLVRSPENKEIYSVEDQKFAQQEQRERVQRIVAEIPNFQYQA